MREQRQTGEQGESSWREIPGKCGRFVCCSGVVGREVVAGGMLNLSVKMLGWMAMTSAGFPVS